MKAIVYDRYGVPEVLEPEETETPVPADDQVLVRVRAAAINPADWYALVGRPWVARVQVGLRQPKEQKLGVDYAGTVEAVGRDVSEFRPGDDVFGARTGALAEYVCAIADRAVVRKPAGVTFEQAAAVPVAAITALQALRDHGQVQPGHKVLINGASGGVGTFAVQIAKALGAEVTGVCSTRNVELARSLGADHVVDYTREDFTRSDRRYDLMIDIAGSRSWRECRRVLASQATFVIVGGSKSNRLLGPLGHVARIRLASLLSSRKAVFFIAKLNKQDLEVLLELIESGQMTPVVERRYTFGDVADAYRYLGEGHAQGKLVVTF